MPNTFAYAMLFAWPVLILLFCRNMPLRQGILIAMIGGFLFLPERTSIDPPMLPTYGKGLAATLAALLLIAVVGTGRKSFGQALPAQGPAARPGWLPESPLFLWLGVLYIVGAMLSTLTNPEPLFYGPTMLRGLTFYDTLSITQTVLLSLIPVLVGRRFFGDREGQLQILRFLVVAGAFYGLLALWEVRMSPQLHLKIYGFFQHSFIQHVRGGHFRPIIFLSHGLVVALFFCLTFLSAVALTRIEETKKRRRHYAMLACYLFVVLVLTRSVGALIIASFLAPFLMFGSLRAQILCAASVACIVLLYPLLRNTGFVPTNSLLSFVAGLAPNRADSLGIRITNENLLLAHAHAKPLFGWGLGQRWRVFNAAGQDISISDGLWVILFGSRGWIGFLALFGMLCVPILRMAQRSNQAHLDRVSAAVAIVLTGNIIDLIPNSGLTLITWLLAGSLIGRMEAVPKPAQDPAPAAEDAARPPPRPRSPYAPVLHETSGWRPAGDRK